MKDRIASFLNYLSVEKGVSPNTITAYRNDLHQFLEFLQTPNVGPTKPQDWTEIDLPILSSYVANLHERGYSETTKARKIASIKSLFSFLEDEGLVQKDPTDALSSPRVGRALPKPLTVEEVDRLLLEASKESTPEARRDSAMLELLYASGMRVSELVSLNTEDVNLDQGHVRCLGKGSKERILPLHEQSIRAVRHYLNGGRPALLNSKDGKALFLNRRGERLTRQGFWLILKGYAQQSDIKTKITPHAIRHSFATHMLRGGASLRYVQELLGHASITTTQVYTYLTDEHVREEYDKAHPRA